MKKITITFITLFQFSCFLISQSNAVIFYNVENLFDTIDDPNKNDNEFIPSYKKGWSKERYNTKINHINQVIDSIDSSPLLVGLVEVENKFVLDDILQTSSNMQHYGVVHFESFDFRGIDCGLLYDNRLLELVDSSPIRYILPGHESYSSRDILYSKFKNGKNELHVYVNHWPSRRNGQKESEPNRLTASRAAQKHIDSILSVNKKAKIILMGDLNDTPTNTSVKEIEERLEPLINQELNDLGGTHAYRGEYSILDHIFISNTLTKRKGFTYDKGSAQIFCPNFLRSTYKGNVVPFRTYGGIKYLDGYSDHFPIFFTISSP